VKILVRATNWIGDAVMSLPAIRAIRDRFPGGHLTLLAKPWVAALYEGERAIDWVIPLNVRSGHRDWIAKWKLVRMLRDERFDLAILFPNSFESAALIRLARIPRIVGYNRDGRGVLLSDAVSRPKRGEIPRHERFYYLELLRRVGLIDTVPDVPEIRLDGAEEAKRRGERLFEARGIPMPVVGISPGAAYGGAKRWLPERFAETGARLAGETGGSVAIFGSAAERSLCQQVAVLSNGRNLAGETTLREFIDMTAACRMFLTNDSGAMHIASAAGVPSVTIFGPTDEAGTGPLGAQALVVREPVDCAPCLLRECPIDHRCMTRVSTDRVVSAAESLLKVRC
jgi:lipopolysaccharide heptosyltransferase II